VAKAAAELGLTHVVVTSVTRDDLADGGAEHFIETIRAIRQQAPEATVEVLVPDFQGDPEAIDLVARERPEVFNHNIETVRRLQAEIRPQASYETSLAVLRIAKEKEPSVATKSGIMLGLGETREEVLEAMADLRSVDCDLLTLGQYLRPSPRHYEIQRYVTPAEFDELAERARELGFVHCASGPFVRSSYDAGTAAELIRQQGTG
jgi:lipoic acid synthetase